MTIQTIQTAPTARLLALSATATTLALLFAQAAYAADHPPVFPARSAAPAPAADKLAQARYLTRSLQWPAALDELKRINDTGSADWHNLMGYTLRSSKAPDLAAAERHYAEALRIDPRHRNALEYSGELYLMKGDLDKAQARLATLGSECGASGCQQQEQLQAAIERYKAAGNKYVPSNW